MSYPTIIVTGAAGFIGFHVTEKLITQGYRVIGIDNCNGYYDPKLKRDRLNRLLRNKGFKFMHCDITEEDRLLRIFKRSKAKSVIHLAAQAGVRYSVENPRSYVDSNLVGFMNILTASVTIGIDHLIYASSSSVYGAGKATPFCLEHNTDKPLNIYAATKKANELMAYAFSNLHGLATTGLRFFTAYGPWGRPDMAYYAFTNSICQGKPIKIHNGGNVWRDFTYIDDIVDAIVSCLTKSASIKTASGPSNKNKMPYVIYNIGNNKPIKLTRFINILEKLLHKKAILESVALPNSDLLKTFADIRMAKKDLNYLPKTKIEVGLKRFVEWYIAYNGNAK